MLDIALLVFFPGLMAYAAISDLLTMTIPNRISLILAAGFLVFAFFAGLTLPQIGLHLLIGFITLIVAFGLFSLGWIGGGDAKLAAATSLWFGFGLMFDYLIWSAMFGGVLTLGILQMRFFKLPAFMQNWKWLVHLHHPQTGIPYGIALAAGALWVFPQSPFWGKALLKMAFL